MKLLTEDLMGIAMIELLPDDRDDDRFEESWFADRRSGSIPPPRTSSVPPMGDEDVDPWLR
jgi:hypothetical protein